MERFDFEFDPRFRPYLRIAGVTPATAWAQVGDGFLEARFGRWHVKTPVANVIDGEVAGPYRWYRAIGVRLSFSDRGLTFGSSLREGVCVRFRTPVPGIDPVGLVRHPGVTMTLRDSPGLLGALQRAGAVFGG